MYPQSQPLQLSIIIVNYNVRYFLEQCLFSVQKAVGGLAVEIIVVDNHSTDGSVAYLAPLFPRIQFISNHDNPGFARANNQALAKCNGEYVLFLNPDTIIPEDCFEKCIAFMQAHPGTGALGVRMLDGKGRFLPESKRSFPSPMASLFKLTGLSAVFPRSKIFNRYALGHLDADKDHEADVLAGAFLFARKSILDQLGGFDERFFLYGEDIDLSFRIREAGWKNMYFAGTEIIHFKGESSGRSQTDHLKFFYSAMLVFVQKHYNAGAARWFSFFLGAAVVVRAVIAFMGRLIKPVLLPVTDALLVWSALQMMRFVWIDVIRDGIDFHVPSINDTLFLLAGVFVADAAFIGLYERVFKISRVITASAVGVLCMLAVYSLLPETMRFSRGVIVCGGIIGSILVLLFRLSVFRKIYARMGYEWDGPTQALIVGDRNENALVKELLANRLPEEQIDWIAPNAWNNNLSGYKKTFRQFPATHELILCEGRLSVSDIIQQVKRWKDTDTRILFHLSGSHSLVGSDFPAVPGRTISTFLHYQIVAPYQQRMKRALDVFVSLLLIFTAPLYILIYKKGIGLLKNAWRVLRGKYTWVGYVYPLDNLPPIRPGVITHAGAPSLTSGEPSQKADTRYAKNYDWWQDVETIIRNYKRLA